MQAVVVAAWLEFRGVGAHAMLEAVATEGAEEVEEKARATAPVARLER